MFSISIIQQYNDVKCPLLVTWVNSIQGFKMAFGPNKNYFMPCELASFSCYTVESVSSIS